MRVWWSTTWPCTSTRTHATGFVSQCADPAGIRIFVFQLPEIWQHALAVFTHKRYEVLGLFVRVCVRVFLRCSFIFPWYCERYIMLARSHHDGFQFVCTCHRAPRTSLRALVPPTAAVLIVPFLYAGACVSLRTGCVVGLVKRRSIDAPGGWQTSVTPQPETTSGTLPLGRSRPMHPRRMCT